MEESKGQVLEQLRRQPELILNAVGEGVYGLDREGNVTFVNPAAADMIGWPMHELVGKSMHAVLHHSHPDGSHYPREDCPIYAAFQDGSVHRVLHEVFWRRDGSSFPVEYISTPMRDESGILIGSVVTFRDMTQHRWAEAVLQRTNEELERVVQERTAKLIEANQQLRELSHLRSRFVAMVCHEFRNPLNNIVLSVSALMRYNEKLTPVEKRDYLCNINANVERMTHMIDEILVIGKIDAQVLDIHLEPIDLIAFCEGLIAEPIHQRSPFPIQFSCRHRQLMAMLDPQILRSILSNLLSNAIRYTSDDQPIVLKVIKHKHHIIFHVQDKGMGILRQDRPHIFEPFHRGQNASNISGTGLGLSIIKQFVELLQGGVKLKSCPGKGTTFTVRLPQHPIALSTQ